MSLTERIRIREKFFCEAGIDPRQFLQAFDNVPGLHYFVKYAQSRTLLNTREYAELLAHPSAPEIVGRRPSEYLAQELAKHYEADDQTVFRTGEPLRNIVEIGFNELGLPDWIVTDKYPLRNREGEVIGIIGTMQSLEGCARQLPHLGEVGKAVAFIRKHIGERILLGDIASHVGMSERHLQRLFHKFVGMSIQQFIIYSRVYGAAYELKRSERPMAEIALAFGFADQSAFTNTFRRLTGVPPREYRKKHVRNSPASGDK
jgi:AraC-like DNA-binding protein